MDKKSVLDLDLDWSIQFASTSVLVYLWRFINPEYLGFASSKKNDSRNWKTPLADVITIFIPGEDLVKVFPKSFYFLVQGSLNS